MSSVYGVVSMASELRTDAHAVGDRTSGAVDNINQRRMIGVFRESQSKAAIKGRPTEVSSSN